MSSTDRLAELEARIRELELQLAATEERHAAVVEQFDALRGTKTFRYTRGLRNVYIWGRDTVGRVRSLDANGTGLEPEGQGYEEWLANRRPSEPIPVAEQPLVELVGTDGEGQLYDRIAGDAAEDAELVAIADPGTELAPEAVLECVRRLLVNPAVDLVYVDSDVRGADGVRRRPFFKPDWSPDLFLGYDYLAPFVVARRETLEGAGGIGAGGYDMRLRLSEQAREIAHVPILLATVPESLETSPAPEREALERAVERRGLDATVESTPRLRVHRVRRKIAGRPRVAIVIPTRDQAKLLRRCVDSVQKLTTYPSYELVVVDNESRTRSARELYSALGSRIIRGGLGGFNFSRLLNVGVAETDAEYILFLNDDTVVLEGGWLEAMLEHAQRPEVGVVGARLVYPNGLPQHEGVLVGRGGVAGNIRLRGNADLPYAVRNCSAVTAACLLTRRDVFYELGGFDIDLRVAFNDVDYCLRAGERGYLVIYTPHAELVHHEGASRGKSHPVQDEQLFARRWNAAGYRDPYYNPNLSLLRPFELRLGGAYPSNPLVFRAR